MKFEPIGLERLARAIGGKHRDKKHDNKHLKGNAIAPGDFGSSASTWITIRGD
jgi:hypothetical protein